MKRPIRGPLFFCLFFILGCGELRAQQTADSIIRHGNSFEFTLGPSVISHRGTFLRLDPVVTIGIGPIGFTAHFSVLPLLSLNPEFDTALPPELVRYGFGFGAGIDIPITSFGDKPLSLEAGFGIKVWEDDVSVGLPIRVRWVVPIASTVGISMVGLYEPLIDLTKERMGNELAFTAGVRIIL